MKAGNVVYGTFMHLSLYSSEFDSTSSSTLPYLNYEPFVEYLLGIE